ncbi:MULTISPECIES: hypothetical protein [Pseudomonas]|uniref:hypothetical protein n=1 Tax=Pseudomonas nitroreducens TaxID=46680 RepID=UPI001E35F6ED|nr:MULTISPECIES: hypothetical protein [Pseudomonas]MCE4073506.1 hypothetical protein [Pseudomonas nitritireducens]MCE4079745.1 hypothetical protein [Pseudomonas nitroreducens]
MKTYQQLREERRTEAAEYLKNHQYRALVDNDDVKVWRCKQPNTNAYAFDIMLTRFGIAVVGDIANLTFGVGLAYGLEFLAGNDVGYYIHSKLDEKCKTREFDEAAFRRAIIAGVCQRIAEEVLGDDDSEALPRWVHEEAERGADGSRWNDLRDLVTAEAKKDDAADEWDQWGDLLAEATDIGDEHQAGAFMNEHCETLGLGPDWWEISVTNPSESLMRELYMIRHAALAILAQKQAAAA